MRGERKPGLDQVVVILLIVGLLMNLADSIYDYIAMEELRRVEQVNQRLNNEMLDYVKEMRNEVKAGEDRQGS